MSESLKIKNAFFQNSGQSLMEVVIAMAIFSLIAASLASLILGSLSLTSEGGLITQADMLAQEGAEAVKAIKNRAWNDLLYDQSAVDRSSANWRFVGEGTSEQLGRFSRTIRFFPIYRDENGNIVENENGEISSDPESRRVNVVVSWQSARNTLNFVEKDFLLTNWDSMIWKQDDWSGGGGQEVMMEENKFFEEDGNIDWTATGTISLKTVATSTFATAGFLVSSAYYIGVNGAPTLLFADWSKPDDCDDCNVGMQIMSAGDNAGTPGDWTSEWSGPEGMDGDESDYYTVSLNGTLVHPDHNEDRWFRYKMFLYGTESLVPTVAAAGLDHKR